MKLFITLFLFLNSIQIWAATGREKWKSANLQNKELLLKEYKIFFEELSKNESSSYGNWKIKQSLIWKILMNEAWAASNLDCIYAGWPSKRVNNLCSSPARNNPSYDNGTCGANEMQCQPLLFGKGLCVPTESRAQRNLAFSNCNRKFNASKRGLQDLIKEIEKDGKTNELLELMDYADQICSSGKQATTPMCRRLEQVVGSIKPQVPVVKKIEALPAITVTNEGRPVEDVIERTEIVEAAMVTNEGLEEVKKIEVLDKECAPINETPKTVPPSTEEVAEVNPEPEPVTNSMERITEDESSSYSVPTPNSPDVIYTPQNALDEINAGKLEFMGRDLLPGRIKNESCVFKSERAYVIYNNCMANKKEAPATDIEVISFDGGVIRYYIENSKDIGSIAKLDRSQYNGTWTISYTPTSKPGDMSMNQLKEFKRQYNNGSPKGECWMGTTAGAKNMSTKANCYGDMKSELPAWGTAAESFWHDPGKDWIKTQQSLRELINATPF